MPTIPYDQMIGDMIEDRPELANEMLEDAVNSLLTGDLDDGRILLRQYVNATIGFQELAKRTGKHDKNLMRMLSATGNPTASNLFDVIQACMKAEGVTISAHVVPQKVAETPASR